MLSPINFMTNQANKRSGMLGTIYRLLPHINDDYAAKLVYTLEDTKTLLALKQDIEKMSSAVGQTNAMSDTLVAKVLLDEITLPAALHQLRIYSNAAAISELAQVLDISAVETELLLNYYASFGANHFFDNAFAAALKDVRDDKTMPDAEKARYALTHLLAEAQQDVKAHPQLPNKNKRAIYQAADTYHLSAFTTASLLLFYTSSGAADFHKSFMFFFQPLQRVNANAHLNASLVAKILLCQLTQQDAQAITLTSKLLKGQILEDDLMVIACRYLREKGPQDIVDTFEAVLQKLPHVKYKEENLGLAVRVLLDGTEPAFTKAQHTAALCRERALLEKALSREDIFAGYEAALARHFAGRKDLQRLLADAKAILQQLPYCQDPLENKELACKVLLGTISQAEALQQATYLRDLHAKTLTKGLAPRILQHYLGTKPADEIIAFFEQTLAPYTFWKSNRPAHEFALQILVEQLNGTSTDELSQFTLQMLQRDTSLDLLREMLAAVRAHQDDPAEAAELMATYQKASLDAKGTDKLAEN